MLEGPTPNTPGEHLIAIWAMLREIQGAIRHIADRDIRTDERLGDHEKRIHILEGWKAKVVGVAIGVSALGTGLVSLVIYAVEHH